MKRNLKFLWLALPLAIVACGGEASTGTTDGAAADDVTVELDTNDLNTKISYALGIQMAEGLSRQQLSEYLNEDAFMAGYRDMIQNKELRISADEGFEALQEIQMKPFLVNKEEGEAFLAENAKRPEVKTLMSGLQIEILREGNGPKPKYGDRVKGHYKLSLIDGSELQSSFGGEPLEFTLEVPGLIAGWVEGLQEVPTGSLVKLYVPQELAYQDAGKAPLVEPYTALIFEIELIEIVE